MPAAFQSRTTDRPPILRRLTGFLIPVAGFLILVGCSRTAGLSDFMSDGCSMFPDRSLISEEDWCDCCFEHDIAYWKGGTEEQRKAADIALRDCILKKTGNADLAEIMYTGVRLGGSPYFYNWYRWGYGWGFERKYQELSPKEVEIAGAKLRQYLALNEEHPCRQ